MYFDFDEIALLAPDVYGKCALYTLGEYLIASCTHSDQVIVPNNHSNGLDLPFPPLPVLSFLKQG